MRDYYLLRVSDKNCTCLARVYLGSLVRFAMPVEGVSVGTLKRVNGSYIAIDVTLPSGQVIEIDRLENEVFKHG